MFSHASSSDVYTSSSTTSPEGNEHHAYQNGHSNGVSTANQENCLICGNIGHGLHFQVITCRACAAFFRRSVKAKRVYKCRRGTRNCDLLKNTNGKPICRFCRLQKCYKMGMRYDLSTNVGNATNDSSESEEEEEEASDTFKIVDGNRLVFDSTRLVAELKEILNQKPRHQSIPTGIHFSKFQELQMAVAKFREELTPKGLVQPSDSYDKLAVHSFIVKYGKKTAHLMMSIEAFADLPFDDRFNLFKHAWNTIYRIEREYTSIEMYGYDFDDHRSLVTKTIAIDGHKSMPVFEGADPVKAMEMMRLTAPIKDEKTLLVTNPMKQLQLTQVELSYIIGLAIFSTYEAKNLSPAAKTMGEQMIDQYSSELHNYYCYELKMSNYANRLVRIVKLIHTARQVDISLKDHFIMAKIFNIFISDIYECELFD